LPYSLLTPFVPIGSQISPLKSGNWLPAAFRKNFVQTKKYINQEEEDRTLLSSKEISDFKRLCCEAGNNF
jgi:hypothetical protein